MPKKKRKNILSQAEQSEKFVATVRELEAAGELSPTAAAGKFMRAFRKLVPAKPEKRSKT